MKDFFSLTISLPYLMCMSGCVSEFVFLRGDIGQTQTERQSGLNWSVFSLPGTVFIFYFFSFKAWAVHCKGKAND